MHCVTIKGSLLILQHQFYEGDMNIKVSCLHKMPIKMWTCRISPKNCGDSRGKKGVKNEMIVNHNFCLQQFIYNHLEMSFYTQVELLQGFSR